jgi:hypothetical protein
MISYIVRMVESAGPRAADEADRIFQKALAASVYKGEVLGYCHRCDAWRNQSRNRSVFCPECRCMLQNQRHAQRDVMVG